MKLTAICNAGIMLEQDGVGLLIDGISRDHVGFSGLDDGIYSDILRRNGMFSSLSGLIFTHCHPDHYDVQRVQTVRETLESCLFFIPDAETPESGKIQCGPFTVYYFETEHMPYTGEDVRHFVFLIRTGEYSVYIASDSSLDAEQHRRILGKTRPDIIFVNPVHLSMPATKALLQELAPKRLIVYHIPTDSADRTGMRRKVSRTAARDFFIPITLVTEHPMHLGEV